VPWAAYGMFSNFRIFTNPDQSAIVPTRFDPLQHPAATLTGNRQAGSAKVPPGDDDQWGRL
jgi:hypothetical protein